MPKDIYKTPDSALIRLLYNGIVRFYKDTASAIFGVEPFSLGDIDTSKEFQLERDRFTEILKKNTGTETVEDAIKVVKEWVEKGETTNLPEQTVPVNIKELEELAQELEDSKKASNYKKEELKRKLERESWKGYEQKLKEKVKVETEKIIPETPPEPGEEIYLNKYKEIKIPPFSQEAKNNLDNLISKVKEDKVGFSRKLGETIVGELQKNKSFEKDKDIELVRINAKQIATSFTDKLVGLSEGEGGIEEKAGILYSQNPIHQTTSLANPQNSGLVSAIPDEAFRLNVTRAAQELSLALENDYIVTKTYLSPVVGKEILTYFYPGHENLIEFDISTEKGPQTMAEFRPHKFIQGYENVMEGNSEILDSLQDQASGFVKDQTISQIKDYSLKALDNTLANTPWYSQAKTFFTEGTSLVTGPEISISGSFFQYQPDLISLWTSEGIPVLASNFTGISQLTGSNVLLTPIFNYNVGSFAINRAIFTTAEGFAGQAFGVNLGNFGITFTKVLTEAGTKFAINISTQGATQALAQAGTQVATSTAATTAAGGVAGTTTLTGIFATLSTWIHIPVLNVIIAAIGAVIGFIAGKLIEWIKNNKETALALLSIPLILLKLPFFIALSPAIIAGLMSLASVGGGLLATVGSFIGIVAVGITGLIAQFVIMALATIVSLGILTSFILYIINSGAYIVPPASVSTIIENPYVDVSKVILPMGTPSVSFENSQLPIIVEYKVTIKPKKSALSSVKIAYSCEVVKEGGSPPCPPIEGTIPRSIDKIYMGESFEFSYKHTFSGNSFFDTLTTDTITVTADVHGYVTATVAAASASVMIGNPPDECPRKSWPIMAGGGLYDVTQGPYAQGCTHRVMNAIDIGVNGAIVVAAHSGVVTAGQDGCYGKYVDIQSTCGSSAFVSRYAHLGAVSVNSGQRVTMGQIIGISDNTGSCTNGPHLHFDFHAPGGGRVNIPNMNLPYLMRSIPVGCCSRATCN